MKKKIFIAIVLGLTFTNPISLSKDDFIQKQEIVSVTSLQKEMVTSPQKEEIKIYSTSILNALFQSHLRNTVRTDPLARKLPRPT